MAVSGGFGEDVGFEGIDQGPGDEAFEDPGDAADFLSSGVGEDVGFAGLYQPTDPPSEGDMFGTGDPGSVDTARTALPSPSRGIDPSPGYTGDPAELATPGGYRGPEYGINRGGYTGPSGGGSGVGGRETISMMEELRQNDLMDFFAHLKGLIPGFDVRALKADFSEASQGINPGYVTDFGIGRAIGDFAGLAGIGLPFSGDAIQAGFDYLDPGKNPTVDDDFTTAGSGSASYGLGGQNTTTVTEGDGGVAPSAVGQPRSAPPVAPVPPASPLSARGVFAGISPRSAQGYRGTRPRFAAGGFVTATAPTPSENLVTATNQAVAAPHPGVLAQGLPGGQLLNPSFMGGGVVRRPSYANGGPVGVAPAGVTPPGAAPSGPVPMQGMQQEMARMGQQHPEQVAQIKAAVLEAIQSGDMDPQELNMGVQLATAAAQNPQLYPQLKQFAEQQGLADPGDLPEQYDEGLVFAILLAGKAAQSSIGGPGLAQAEGQPPQPPGVPQAGGQPSQGSFALGGEVPEGSNTDKTVAITAHEGEGVLHAGVLKAKGMDFLNKLNEQYNQDGTPSQKA